MIKEEEQDDDSIEGMDAETIPLEEGARTDDSITPTSLGTNDRHPPMTREDRNMRVRLLRRTGGINGWWAEKAEDDPQ